MDLSVVKTNKKIELKRNVDKGYSTNFSGVRLPLVEEVAHCAIKATYDGKMQMILRCPRVCVQNQYDFAVEFKLGRFPLYNAPFNKVTADGMVVTLGLFTIDALNGLYHKMKICSDKVYLDFTISFKCEPFTPLQRLLRDIASPELADFTFDVGGRKFPAHKYILTTRSPVFARMLANNYYNETQQSVMKITDTAANVFEIFLEFVYKASVPKLSLLGAVELIKLAEKYDVGDLKSLCETAILDQMKQSDRPHEIFTFAHQYNCSHQLIAKAFERVKEKYFIGKPLPDDLCNNPKDVQRLVTKMMEFNDTLQEIREDLTNPAKKMKKN